MSVIDKHLETEVEKEEGLKLTVYKDTLGIDTVACGYNLEANPQHLSAEEIADIRENGITKERAIELLDNQLTLITNQLEAKIPWVDDLDAVRHDVLCDMAYNMGIGNKSHGLLCFTHTLSLVKDGRYAEAADAMIASKWAKQVGHRAFVLAEQIRTGIAS